MTNIKHGAALLLTLCLIVSMTSCSRLQPPASEPETEAVTAQPTDSMSYDFFGVDGWPYTVYLFMGVTSPLGEMAELEPVLTECLDYCKSQHISILLVSELSRLGRNTFEVLSTVKDLMDCGINVYFQKEQMYLLDQNGKPGMFTPILIATLGTCAEMERENIRFRLNSGLANYKAKGGRVGRKTGSIKTEEVKKEEYREVIALLKRGYSVRNTAKLTGLGISTVQRVKKEFVD